MWAYICVYGFGVAGGQAGRRAGAGGGGRWRAVVGSGGQWRAVVADLFVKSSYL